MFTKEAGGLLGFFKSNDSYDPDRLAADQQKLRAFYLTQGYADFRVVSALAELTPDRRDFVITYVVEEGPRYKFGTVEAESELARLQRRIREVARQDQAGRLVQRQAVEDTVTGLNEIAGACGYAFADVSPDYERDAEKRMMNITFQVGETPRVYVERIDIHGNTVTRDKVIRREFRLNEGDAFNALKVKRSQDRIQCLGFSRRIWRSSRPRARRPTGSSSNVDVEEKSTGELQLVGRLFEPREVHPLGLGRPAQLHGQGPDPAGRGQLFALFASRSSRASPSPICSTRTSCSAAKSSAATTTASITIERRPQQDLWPDSRSAASCGSASRSPNM